VIGVVRVFVPAKVGELTKTPAKSYFIPSKQEIEFSRLLPFDKELTKNLSNT